MKRTANGPEALCMALLIKCENISPRNRGKVAMHLFRRGATCKYGEAAKETGYNARPRWQNMILDPKARR